jgi:hypothetical protein
VNEPAVKLEIPPTNLPIRRFGLADLSEQGVWIMERLLKAYPNQNQRSIIGWLNGVIFNNEFLCLYQPDCVCFAGRTAADILSAKMVVRELFVWCKDPKDAQLVANAAGFYPWMVDWAKTQGIDRVIVCENSDVPEETVRKMFPRVHEFKTIFVRV